jgi:hypothetical protein
MEHITTPHAFIALLQKDRNGRQLLLSVCDSFISKMFNLDQASLQLVFAALKEAPIRRVQFRDWLFKVHQLDRCIQVFQVLGLNSSLTEADLHMVEGQRYLCCNTAPLATDNASKTWDSLS